MANLPLSAFGVSRHEKDGMRPTCFECQAQYPRLKRKAKYKDLRSHIDDSVIRSVRMQNIAVLDTALKSTLEVRALNYLTKVPYKVFFGPSSVNGMHSIAFFDFNSVLYREFIFSGGDANIQEIILNILRDHNLRLEYTDGDLTTSLSTIYYV